MPHRQWPCRQVAWASQLVCHTHASVESFKDLKVHEVKPHYSEESVQVEEMFSYLDCGMETKNVHIALNLVE